MNERARKRQPVQESVRVAVVVDSIRPTSRMKCSTLPVAIKSCSVNGSLRTRRSLPHRHVHEQIPFLCHVTLMTHRAVWLNLANSKCIQGDDDVNIQQPNKQRYMQLDTSGLCWLLLSETTCFFLNKSKLAMTILSLPGRQPQSIRHTSLVESNFLTIHLISITASPASRVKGEGSAVIGWAWEDVLTIDSSDPTSHNRRKMQEESQWLQHQDDLYLLQPVMKQFAGWSLSRVVIKCFNRDTVLAAPSS